MSHEPPGEQEVDAVAALILAVLFVAALWVIAELAR